MHFHNFYTRCDDNLILSINTGNAHKEIILPQTIINTFKKCKGEASKHTKNDAGGEMVVAFIMTKLNYLVVSLFRDLVRSLTY